MNIVVIGILIFLGIMVVDGYQKGLVKALLSMVAGAVIFIAVTVLTPHVTNFLVEKTPLLEKLTVVCEQGIEDMVQKEMGEVDLESLTQQEELAELSKVFPPALIEKMQVALDLDTLLDSSGMVSGAAEQLARLMISGISFVSTILVLTIIYLIIWYAFDLVSKLPMLEDANKLAGALLGLVKGTLIVWIAFAILALTSATEFSMKITSMIAESQILLWLYENNFFLQIILMFLK